MKIYPSQLYHQPEYITARNIDRNLSIPLAYLNNSNPTYKFERDSHDDFKITSRSLILPNQVLDSEDVLIFDEYGNTKDSATLINRQGDKYVYSPNNMVEFTPLLFNYNVTAKRNITYNNSKMFNFNVACVDDPEKLDFTKKLEQILINHNGEGYLNNILINSGEKSIGPVEEISNRTDFVFIESPDGEHYNFMPDEDMEDTGGSNRIPIESFLGSNMNTWIISDDHKNFPMVHGIGYNVRVKNPNIKRLGSFEIKDYYNVNDLFLRTYTVHNLFDTDICPILILEYINQGYLILSSSEIFDIDKADIYRDVVFEVMLYVYSNSYIKSDFVPEYITPYMPDYEVVNGSLKSKNEFISETRLNDLLRTNTSEYVLTNIEITDGGNENIPNGDLMAIVEGITFSGVSNNKVKFKMVNNNKLYSEPERPPGWKSIYHNHKIYYIEELHYLMETKIGEANEEIDNKLFVLENGNNIEIKLYPFKSSKHGLDIRRDLRLTIPGFKTDVNGQIRAKNETYALCIDKTRNELRYFFNDDYMAKVEDNDEEVRYCALLTTITVIEKLGEDYLTDMRVRGGGLPEDMPDNFNLLDIGHIYGRPYRQANTLVFTLPKKYEIYKDEILEVINKYKVAEDYTVLFFEDDEMDGE
mgnify:CR=1 FL=1